MSSVDEIRATGLQVEAGGTSERLRRRLKFLEITASSKEFDERYYIRATTVANACRAIAYLCAFFVGTFCFFLAIEAVARFAVAVVLGMIVVLATQEINAMLDRFCSERATISVPLLKICEEHLEQPVQKANEHYLAVCRALITEAIDMKSFLEKVSSAGESLRNFANINNNNNGAQDDTQGEEFPKLNFTEWAHLWITVVSDLRVGVKLKKVEGYTRNAEFELTPYEILMEDIKQRKYRLKKIAMNGGNPQSVKTNPHDIILDFIKSRPTLKPTANRELRPPPPRSKSLHERLLEQIQELPSPLRMLWPPQESPLRQVTSDGGEDIFKDPAISSSKSCDFNSVKMSVPDRAPPEFSNRRLIKAPPLADFTSDTTISTISEMEDDSEEDDSSFIADSITTDDLTNSTVNDDGSISPFRRHNAGSNPNSLRSSGTSGVSSGGAEEPDPLNFEKPGLFTRNTSTVRRKKLLCVDLPPSPVRSGALESSVDDVGEFSTSYTKYSARNGVRRAQSMSVRPATSHRSNTNTAEERRLAWRERCTLNQQKATPFDPLLPPPKNSSSPVAKRDRSRQQTFSEGRSTGLQRTMSDKRAFGRPTRFQDRWKHPVEYVDLRMEELIHIKEVKARRDLDNYQGYGVLYTNLMKGKMCYNCRVREFSIFYRPRTCQMCLQKVCSKCSRKVRAPTEEYMRIPVHELTPSYNQNTSVDIPSRGDENSRLHNGRTRFDPTLTVVRESNIDDCPLQTNETQMVDTSRSWNGRKMEVCEDCLDFITRRIYAYDVAGATTTSSKPACSQNNLSDLARSVFSRSTSVADRILRRSMSSAGLTASPTSSSVYARRANVTASRSIQSFRVTAVAK